MPSLVNFGAFWSKCPLTQITPDKMPLGFLLGIRSMRTCKLRSYAVQACFLGVYFFKEIPSLLRVISRVISARALKMAAFSLRLGLAIEVNRHFLENEYGDLSFFCCVELSNKFLEVK